jgi:hypothetical protein
MRLVIGLVKNLHSEIDVAGGQGFESLALMSGMISKRHELYSAV